MILQLNIADAKAKLSEMVDLAIHGGDVIIARAGKPIARIVPIETTQAKRSNFFGGLSHLGPVPDDALAPEPDDAYFGFEDQDDTALSLVAAPEAFPFRDKD
jgi:prevent-host-death family protein